jgi:hypothetical protein
VREWPTKTLTDKDHEVHDKTNTIYSLKKIYLFIQDECQRMKSLQPGRPEMEKKENYYYSIKA